MWKSAAAPKKASTYLSSEESAAEQLLLAVTAGAKLCNNASWAYTGIASAGIMSATLLHVRCGTLHLSCFDKHAHF